MTIQGADDRCLDVSKKMYGARVAQISFAHLVFWLAAFMHWLQCSTVTLVFCRAHISGYGYIKTCAVIVCHLIFCLRVKCVTLKYMVHVNWAVHRLCGLLLHAHIRCMEPQLWMKGGY